MFILNQHLNSDPRNNIQVEEWSNLRIIPHFSQRWRDTREIPPPRRLLPYYPPLYSNRCPVLQRDGLVVTCYGTRKRQDTLLDQTGLVCLGMCTGRALFRAMGVAPSYGPVCRDHCTLQTMYNEDKVIKIILCRGGEICPHIITFTLKKGRS